MSYSPLLGPALLVLLVVSSLPTAYRHVRARTPSTGKGVFVAIGGGSVVAAVGLVMLNRWVNWTGDAVAALAVIVFLLATRQQGSARGRRGGDRR